MTWARWGPSCHPVSSQPLTISGEENGRQRSRMGVHLELHCSLGDVEDTQCAITITCCHVLLLWVSTRSRAPSQAEATLGTPSGERSALPWEQDKGPPPRPQTLRLEAGCSCQSPRVDSSQGPRIRAPHTHNMHPQPLVPQVPGSAPGTGSPAPCWPRTTLSHFRHLHTWHSGTHWD